MDGIHLALGQSKATFIKNILDAQSSMSKDKYVNISEAEHQYAMEAVLSSVFDNSSTNFRPSCQELIDSMNLKASTGLPQPWISKRQSIDLIRDVYARIEHEAFDIVSTFKNMSERLEPLTAAFVRMQITNSGLKVRLVFAVSVIFVIAETYFNLILKFIIFNVNSHAIHGYTQPEISALVRSTNRRHALCIDYKAFDQAVPTFVILAVAHICLSVMRLTHYETRLFLDLITYFVRLPVFYPEVPYTIKRSGIPSGSGFTSIFGSLCNTYMLHSAMRRYCKDRRIPLESNYDIYVSSDDTIISSDFYVEFTHFSRILKEMYDVRTELESYSKPGDTEVFFLGSLWKQNKPTRNVDRMFARILFGSGNMPRMSDLELFQSRCYEILGNTVQYSTVYKTFNIPYPKRVFRFVELADHATQQEIKSQLRGFEKRGFWQTVELDTDTANRVWLQR